MMHRWLDEQSGSGTVDFIHNHSLWMMPNVYAGLVSRHGRGRLSSLREVRCRLAR